MSSKTIPGTDEAGLRCEAVCRFLQGESPSNIARDLQRSRQWVYACWWRYCADPQTDFADASRTPHHMPSQTSPEVRRMIVRLRKELESGASATMPYGLIGAGEIQTRLAGLQIDPVPSKRTIQRILAQHGLTHAVGIASPSAYYPYPNAWAADALHASDIVVRHVRGQHKVYNFHTIDVFTHRVAMTPALDNTSTTACAHLLKSWEMLGLPHIQQLDNEGAFCGGHTHPRVIGKVIRLCLYCGVEAFFIPTYEPKRNHWVENFHELWDMAFWSRTHFTSLAHQQAEQPRFEHWYVNQYHPPALGGLTIAEFTRAMTFRLLTPDLAARIPDYTQPCQRLPITAGYFHIMRKVKSDGTVELLNDVWMIGRSRAGEYVRATINPAQHQIAFWHQVDAASPARMLLKRIFRPKESVHDLRPQFRRNCKRCRDCLPA